MFSGLWASLQALLSRRSLRLGIVATAGFVVIVLGATYIVKRRKRKQKARNSSDVSDHDLVDYRELAAAAPATVASGMASPYGAGTQVSQWFSKQQSASTSEPSALSTLHTDGHNVSDENLSEEELWHMGLDAFHTAVSYWERAQSVSEDGGSGKFPDLKDILERAHGLQEFLLQVRHVRVTPQVQAVDALVIPQRSDRDEDEMSSSSSTDSFQSAQEADSEADVMTAEDLLNGAAPDVVTAEDLLNGAATVSDGLVSSRNQSSASVGLHAFYDEGIALARANAVPHRTMRTVTLHCSSDLDFLAKLSCVRKAFNLMFEADKTRQYVSQAGKRLVTCLLRASDKTHTLFEEAYDRMIHWVSDQSNWKTLAGELWDRRVECVTFYDVVLDFVLLDAFTDAENPPSAVVAVLNNRWLTQGFKESAFGTAVWSVIKAKSKMVKVSGGFFTHFYGVMEHISPVLAWGLLGPNEDLKTIMLFVKDEVMGFLYDVFSVDTSNYSSNSTLAEDILKHLQIRTTSIFSRLDSAEE